MASRVTRYDLIRKQAHGGSVESEVHADDGFQALRVERVLPLTVSQELPPVPEACSEPLPSPRIEMFRTSRPQPPRVEAAARLVKTLRYYFGRLGTA